MMFVALAIGAGAVSFRLNINDAPSVTTPSLPEYKAALWQDSANAYKWADLAEALGDAGREAEAKRAFTRAVALSPQIPMIWVRYTNFCFIHNDLQQGLKTAERVLATVPDYDEILFYYFDRIVENPAAVLAAIGGDRRATRAWLEHMMTANNAVAARNTWSRIADAGFGDDKLAVGYVDYLLRNKRWENALQTWAAWLGERQGDYPARNLLFNGKFQRMPLGGPLDWRLTQSVDEFENVLGKNGAMIRFLGKTNVNYDHLSQVAILPRQGAYRLTMRVKTAGLTTNEGIRLAIPELGLASESLTGSHDWTTVSLDFSVAQSRSLRVGVVRRPSGKFDNKIEGTVWIDGISLGPVGLIGQTITHVY